MLSALIVSVPLDGGVVPVTTGVPSKLSFASTGMVTGMLGRVVAVSSATSATGVTTMVSVAMAVLLLAPVPSLTT